MTGSFDLAAGAFEVRTDRLGRTPVPWKNGQGTTQVVAETEYWRISVADEPIESCFSRNEMYDRVFIPIGSETIKLSGTALHDADPTGVTTQRAKPLEILHFPGEWAPACTTAAPTRALKIMTRRGLASTQVHISDTPISLDISTVRVYFSVPSEVAILAPPYTVLRPKADLAGPVVSIQLSNHEA